MAWNFPPVSSVYLLLAFFLGAVMAIYLPMNSSVAKYLSSSLLANLTFFLVAFLTAMVLYLVWGTSDSLRQINKVPIHLYLTGIISALVVLGTTFLIPHIGARKFFILLIAGQIITAIAVSHYGILESPKDPISFHKILGALLVIAGASISMGH